MGSEGTSCRSTCHGCVTWNQHGFVGSQMAKPWEGLGVCWGCMLNLVEGRGWWKEGGLGGNEFNFFGFLRTTLSYI